MKGHEKVSTAVNRLLHAKSNPNVKLNNLSNVTLTNAVSGLQKKTQKVRIQSQRQNPAVSTIGQTKAVNVLNKLNS